MPRGDSLFYFLSLGIYQAYINVAIFVYLVVSFVDILNGNNYKEVFKILIIRLVIVVSSMAVYYIGYLLITNILNIEISSGYNSLGSVGGLSISSILNKFYLILEAEAKFIIRPRNYNINLIFVVNVICILTIIVVIIKRIIENKLSKINILSLFIITLLMPFGICAVTLISNINHELVVYALFMLYIFIFVLIEDIKTKYLNKIIIILMSILIFDNVVFSNQIYLKKDLEASATLSTMTRVINRIEQTDGYELGKTNVAIIGTLGDSNINIGRNGFNKSGVGLGYDYSTTYDLTYNMYLNYLLAYNIKLIGRQETKDMVETKEVKDMPCFPDKDSIKFINDILVVKLSD